MNLSHLRYITEVAKTGSITKAAQNLYMGQPNLSKAIREMEKNMGVAIFKRTSKGVEPTEKGREIVERANMLINSMEEFEKDFCGKKDKVEKISVAVCGSEYCIGILEDYGAAKAGEKIFLEYFRCNNILELSDKIKEGSLSFGISRVSMPHGGEVSCEKTGLGLKGQILAEGRILAVLNGSSPLTKKERVTAADLQNMTQVSAAGYCFPQNPTGISAADPASGERIIEKDPSCFMLVSALDVSQKSGSKKIVYRELEPELCFKDILLYSEGKRFTEREKELIEKLSRFTQS